MADKWIWCMACDGIGGIWNPDKAKAAKRLAAKSDVPHLIYPDGGYDKCQRCDGKGEYLA